MANTEENVLSAAQQAAAAQEAAAAAQEAEAEAAAAAAAESERKTEAEFDMLFRSLIPCTVDHTNAYVKKGLAQKTYWNLPFHRNHNQRYYGAPSSDEHKRVYGAAHRFL